MVSNIDKALVILGFLSFGLFDAYSTLVVVSFLGTAEYETSIVLRNAFTLWGYGGLALLKVGVTALCMLTIYLLMEKFNIVVMGRYLAIGTILAGLFAGISNLNILWHYESISVFGVGAQAISIGILVFFAALGIIKDKWIVLKPSPSTQ
jgi:hypothetical protein